jgi:hypothetical protein
MCVVYGIALKSVQPALSHTFCVSPTSLFINTPALQFYPFTFTGFAIELTLYDVTGLAQSRTSKMSSEAVSSAGSFQSHLPRPLTVGRSASSGSSTGAAPDNAAASASSPSGRTRKSLSIESLNNTNDEEENLLADCIFSGANYYFYFLRLPTFLNIDIFC